MIIDINITHQDNGIISLIDHDGQEKAQKMIGNLKTISGGIIQVLDELLDENDCMRESVTEIRVNPGPGSFTSIRTGVAVANALAYAFDVPINGQKGIFVEPRYDRSPNISKNKTLVSEIDPN
ncbi:hypothetical protein KC571_02975 [candidate division WWE3 bacterium]|uniref:Gcp-like domain-containing protein n=1 Tax=candidate division WWE3 bacterium TaxID=2053526 RepID=A0A955LH14_UNCKA|nr:hypothetical protein [candidate division WWE3 bacterium]